MDQTSTSSVSSHAKGLSVKWEASKKKLMDTDLKVVLEEALRVRQALEALPPALELSCLMNTLLPTFFYLLNHNNNKRCSPNLNTSSMEHIVRNRCLEFLSRLPQTQALRPHAIALLQCALQVLVHDNEDNALLASKIIFDVHKNYRPMPQEQVQPYLDFVLTAYRNLRTSVQRNFTFKKESNLSSSSSTTASASQQKNEKAQSTEINPKQGDKEEKRNNSEEDPFTAAAAFGSASSLTPITVQQQAPKNPRIALKSTFSFRVLTECPLTVMLLYNLYPNFLKMNIPSLINLMMEALSLRAPPLPQPPAQQQTVQGNPDHSFAHVTRHYYTRSRELVAAQTKTLSFLTYLLRGFGDLIKPFEDRLAQNVVTLMTICPRQAMATRKELLVATRHILATDHFGKGFFRHVDSFLDERILLGSSGGGGHLRQHLSSSSSSSSSSSPHPSSQSHDAHLRPLAYSTLADLIHYARPVLQPKQLSRVVYIFSRVLHDVGMRQHLMGNNYYNNNGGGAGAGGTCLPIQITSVRLLLNVVDIIYNNHASANNMTSSSKESPDPRVGIDMLDRILHALVHKLETSSKVVEKLRGQPKEEEKLKQNQMQHEEEKNESHESNTSSQTPMGWSDNYNKKWGNVERDSLRDLQSMVRSIVVGMKTVIWCIANCRQQQKEKDKQQGDNHRYRKSRFTKWEEELLDRYVVYALECIQVFTIPTGHNLTEKNGLTQQHRDVLTYFAASFSVMDPYQLKKTLGRRIDAIVKAVVQDSNMIIFVRHLLVSNQTTSYEFCGVLTKYLVDHLPELVPNTSAEYVFFEPPSETDDRERKHTFLESAKKTILERQDATALAGKQRPLQQRAVALMLLFERILKSLSSHPGNESAFRPHLRRLVIACLRLSFEKGREWPDNYCVLLRCVFRSISAGKFEESYNEILPLIPAILNGLFRIFQGTEDTHLSETIIELCLTIPAKILSLLPHMPLLIRLITPALKSDKGEIVNLGLRTLEFWVDNLNPGFLYPVLSKQEANGLDLMAALSTHLRPAPYPYGLLTLRLLGKLGGKNRHFLRDPVSLVKVKEHEPAKLSLSCNWNQGKFHMNVPLPLDRAVVMLERLASSPPLTLREEEEEEEEGKKARKSEDDESNSFVSEETIAINRNEFSKLVEMDPAKLDVDSYCRDVAKETRATQAKSCLTIVCTALRELVKRGFGKDDKGDSSPKKEFKHFNLSKTSSQYEKETLALRLAIQGIILACAIEETKEAAIDQFSSFSKFILSLLRRRKQFIARIDANGSLIDTENDKKNETTAQEQSDETQQKQSLGSLQPFGYFQLSGPFEKEADPFVLFDVVCQMVGGKCEHIRKTAFDQLKYLVETITQGVPLTDPPPFESNIVCEYTLASLCRHSYDLTWDISSTFQEALCFLIGALGSKWCKIFEVQIIHCTLFSLKKAPREIPFAAVREFQFFSNILATLYRVSPNSSETDPRFLFDLLQLHATFPSEALEEFEKPSDRVVGMLIADLASPKQIVRYALRYALKYHVFLGFTADQKKQYLEKHLTAIKRVVFTRSLRLLPLPEQIGVVEALTTFVDCVPDLLPMTNQHLLAFLSEFLKLSSIADGEMTDSNIVGYVVDKNGFTATPSPFHSPTRYEHFFGIFLRRGCVARTGIKNSYAIMPTELPNGVQLRVSALRLLNSVIRHHASAFFDADTKTSIGNIRPHVISLLFRSLVSQARASVLAAHEALKDVLTLSVDSRENPDGSKSQSRLPKELLQTCIRPVLLNLRDYTQLSVPLLRGLSRLLSLLSSWFNQTLGEKLLEHLQKWTDPECIVSRKIWKLGEEPLVAARILDLFALLPHASKFVEPLVKTVLNLEDCFARFRSNSAESPYRRPLAKYLNKHCHLAVRFFFQRLKTPIYSELFQRIVELDESVALRKYLGTHQCTVSLLNVCFERPLAIIRSEKTSATKGQKQPAAARSPAEILSMHGVAVEHGSGSKQKEALLRQDIDVKQKKIVALQQEAARTKEVLHAVAAGGDASKEGQASIEDAKKRHKFAQLAFEKGQKELSESKQRYASEIAHPTAEQPSTSANRRMTSDALELQHQGFKLVNVLVSYDSAYLKDHNDVVKAFRWLWRSKGRHLRLQHEELMPPRFHDESRLLSDLLLSYSKAFLSDVDVLFELLRIFLQPTTSDFTFVKDFLSHTVSVVLTVPQQKHILQRFFVLLSGEGPEETKVLSIDLVVFPMLNYCLRQRRDSGNVNFNDKTTNKEDPDHGGGQPQGSCKEPLKDVAKEPQKSIIDDDFMKKFVQEMLFKNGTAACYGDRLSSELLRLTSLFVETVPMVVKDYQRELLKFAWNMLKSDNSTCKNWAYLTICHFMKAFRAPMKIYIQVYVALLRAHQHEGKWLVRVGIEILFQILASSQIESDKKMVVEHTNRVLFEEGNNISQLLHIWQIIVAHKEIFGNFRGMFSRHIVSSVTRLGHPPNCPAENRALSLELVEILLEWEESNPKNDPSSDLLGEKRRGSGGDIHGSKKRKLGDGHGIALPPKQKVDYISLDSETVSRIAAFLIRTRILLADSKVDGEFLALKKQASALLRSLFTRARKCTIHPSCFERVLLACKEDAEAMTRNSNNHSGNKKIEKTKLAGKTHKHANLVAKGAVPTTARDDPRSLTPNLLISCLEIFEILAAAPGIDFVTANHDIIRVVLSVCFAKASRFESYPLLRNLRTFLITLFKCGQIEKLDRGLESRIRVLLESFILKAVLWSGKPSSSEFQKKEDSRNHHNRLPVGISDMEPTLAYFSLSTIEAIGVAKPGFVRTFLGALVDLADKLVTFHIQDVNSAQRHGNVVSNHSKGTPEQFPTPLYGILEGMWVRNKPSLDFGRISKSNYGGRAKQRGITVSIRGIICCLRLIASTRMQYKFTAHRQVFLKTLTSVLDSSDDVQLLIASVQIVARWLLIPNGCGPLTQSEKIGFLHRFAALDARSLHPIASQAVSDVVAHTCLNIYQAGVETLFGGEMSPHLSSEDVDHLSFENAYDVLNKCFVTCLLNPNPVVRAKVSGMYKYCAENKHQLWLRQIYAEAPFHCLAKLFGTTNFDGVGGRFWPVIIVDVFLDQLECSDKRDEMDQSLQSVLQSNMEGSVEYILEAMSDLCHGDTEAAQSLFENFVGIVWKKADSDLLRGDLIQPIEVLLSRPYHCRAMRNKSQTRSPIHALCKLFLKLNPTPFFEPDLFVYLASIHGVWCEVLSLLEKQYRILQSAPSHDNKPLSDELCSAIRICYQNLDDQNSFLNWSLKSCSLTETKHVISMDVHGLTKQAMHGYKFLMDQADSRGDPTAANMFEMDLWEHRWVQLQREMCQLEVVKEYAIASGEKSLELESAWKANEWENVSTLVSGPELTAMMENGDPRGKMSEIMAAIMDGKLDDVENIHAQTAQLCLQQWQLLPSLSCASYCHSSLLHFFHRLVEQRESVQIMTTTLEHASRRTIPDLKNLLSAWRDRLPNDYEELTRWDEIILWRSHMFGLITSHFNWSEPGTLATLHDREWTTIRMAKTARKHGLREVSLLVLSKLTDCAMDVSDAFAKLREQILVYHNPESEMERTGGLNMVNTTNLSYFNSSQKSELFRLKAQFLSSLGGRSKANQAYCHAVQICPSYSRSWVSWGALCSSLGRIAEKQCEQSKNSTDPNKEGTSYRKVAQYLAQAMGCYLEAIQCDTHEWCRIHLSRCLWMLAKDGSSSGVLCSTLEMRGTALPSWVWLPWCPQLLTSLYRCEGRAVKAILTGIAQTYPQALYFPLRAFYLERRDVERARGPTTAPTGSHKGSVTFSEELMSSLRRAHASLWSSLEAILEELIVKFRPSYEEELLATITALLERAESQCGAFSDKKDGEDEENVTASISKTLAKIAAKFFRESTTDSTTSKLDERARKADSFKKKYRHVFEVDFLGTTTKETDEKPSLKDFLQRLRKWKEMLEEQVSATPLSLPLVMSSQSLALFASDAPDLWPMSCDPHATRLQFVERDRSQEGEIPTPTSSTANKSAAVNAALHVADAGAYEGIGGEYGGGSACIEIPGQYSPNISSAHDVKPTPELHAKLLRFEPRIRVVRRNDQLVRRVGMVGSDGRRYLFLLQFAIPYWTRTDERTAQIMYILDKVFRRDIMCSRNFFSVQPTAVIPIAQRLRMTGEVNDRVSLSEVYKERCAEGRCSPSSILSAYNKLMNEKLRKENNAYEPAERQKYLLSVKLEVFKAIRDQIDEQILLKRVMKHLVSAEKLYHFRRVFASQLAANSLLQHSLCVSVRTPSRVALCEETGRVLAPEFRFSYSNQGFLESQSIPFRVTQNMTELAGEVLLEGRFVPGMAMIATALKGSIEDIDACLRLLMRDDIIAWYTSKSMAKTDSKTQELEKQLADRVAKNVSQFHIKIGECALRKSLETPTQLPTDPVDKKVQELFAEASSDTALSKMEPSFQAWL